MASTRFKADKGIMDALVHLRKKRGAGGSNCRRFSPRDAALGHALLSRSSLLLVVANAQTKALTDGVTKMYLLTLFGTSRENYKSLKICRKIDYGLKSFQAGIGSIRPRSPPVISTCPLHTRSPPVNSTIIKKLPTSTFVRRIQLLLYFCPVFQYSLLAVLQLLCCTICNVCNVVLEPNVFCVFSTVVSSSCTWYKYVLHASTTNVLWRLL